MIISLMKRERKVFCNISSRVQVLPAPISVYFYFYSKKCLSGNRTSVHKILSLNKGNHYIILQQDQTLERIFIYSITIWHPKQYQSRSVTDWRYHFYVISIYVSIIIYFFNHNENTISLYLNHAYIIIEYTTWSDINHIISKTSCYPCEEPSWQYKPTT